MLVIRWVFIRGIGRDIFWIDGSWYVCLCIKRVLGVRNIVKLLVSKIIGFWLGVFKVLRV